MPSEERARAARTSCPCNASTPTTRLKRRGWSGATTTVWRCEPSTSTAPPARATSSASAASVADAGTCGEPSRTPWTRRTSVSTRPAFQRVQARGPVASESASVRAASRSRKAGLRTVVRDARDDLRVVEVATRRDRREQQVVPHEVDERLDVFRLVAHACRDRPSESDARFGVITGRALPEVVQQEPDEQEIGALHAVGELGSVRCRLEQVPIDGEAVERVALRPAPHRRTTPAGCRLTRS